MGGSVNAGQMYRVNEAGMEYFSPNTSGQVIPLGQGGIQIGNLVVNANTRQGGQEAAEAFMETIRMKQNMIFGSGGAN